MSEDRIGYKNPPKHTQFQKGRSGNPRGRPKGRRNLKTDVQEALNTLVSVMSNGAEKKVPIQRAVVMRLVEKALKGDSKAIDRLLALAQIYNDEEPASAEPTKLTDQDKDILKSFITRHLEEEEEQPAKKQARRGGKK